MKPAISWLIKKDVTGEAKAVEERRSSVKGVCTSYREERRTQAGRNVSGPSENKSVVQTDMIDVEIVGKREEKVSRTEPG